MEDPNPSAWAFNLKSMLDSEDSGAEQWRDSTASLPKVLLSSAALVLQRRVKTLLEPGSETDCPASSGVVFSGRVVGSGLVVFKEVVIKLVIQHWMNSSVFLPGIIGCLRNRSGFSYCAPKLWPGCCLRVLRMDAWLGHLRTGKGQLVFLQHCSLSPFPCSSLSLLSPFPFPLAFPTVTQKLIFQTGADSKLLLNLPLAGRKNYVPSVCSTSPAISLRFKKTPAKHKSVSICDSPQSSVYQNKL